MNLYQNGINKVWQAQQADLQKLGQMRFNGQITPQLHSDSVGRVVGNYDLVRKDLALRYDQKRL